MRVVPPSSMRSRYGALRRTDIKITATTLRRLSLTQQTLARAIGGPAVRQGRVAKVLPLQSRRTEHEPKAQLPGQRRGPVLLQQFEAGTDQEAYFKHRELALNDCVRSR